MVDKAAPADISYIALVCSFRVLFLVLLIFTIIILFCASESYLLVFVFASYTEDVREKLELLGCELTNYRYQRCNPYLSLKFSLDF